MHLSSNTEIANPAVKFLELKRFKIVAAEGDG